METIAFLGCSRGFGRRVVQEFSRQKLLDSSLLVARGEKNLISLKQEIGGSNEILTVDFSLPAAVEFTVEKMIDSKIRRVFYFAGGGPHGSFASKNWKDHQWALQVSFLTPAHLLHKLMDKNPEFLKQVVFVGSAIADDRADPLASSYSAAKHGLRGLVESVIEERPTFDLRFFRPSYMDTDMLPKNARPRQEGKSIQDPKDLAKKWVDWVLDSSGPKIFTPEA